MTRRLILMAFAPMLVFLQACGGAGAGSSPAPPPPPLPSGANVAPLIVDAGPAQLGVNLPSVSVRLVTLTKSAASSQSYANPSRLWTASEIEY